MPCRVEGRGRQGKTLQDLPRFRIEPIADVLDVVAVAHPGHRCRAPRRPLRFRCRRWDEGVLNTLERRGLARPHDAGERHQPAFLDRESQLLRSRVGCQRAANVASHRSKAISASKWISSARQHLQLAAFRRPTSRGLGYGPIFAPVTQAPVEGALGDAQLLRNALGAQFAFPV